MGTDHRDSNDRRQRRGWPWEAPDPDGPQPDWPLISRMVALGLLGGLWVLALVSALIAGWFFDGTAKTTVGVAVTLGLVLLVVFLGGIALREWRRR